MIKPFNRETVAHYRDWRAVRLHRDELGAAQFALSFYATHLRNINGAHAMLASVRSAMHAIEAAQASLREIDTLSADKLLPWWVRQNEENDQ